MGDSFFDTILTGVKSIAPTVANYVLPGSGSLVEGLLRSVTNNNDSPIEELAEQVQNNPELYIKFQQLVMDQEIKLADIKAKRIESVNKTMRSESKSEHWPQWLWRPFNGFLFGTTIFCVYFVIPIANVMFDPEPSIPIPSIPEWIWIGWGAVLGVTTWDRGKEKRIKAGEQKSGLIEGIISSIKKS